MARLTRYQICNSKGERFGIITDPAVSGGSRVLVLPERQAQRQPAGFPCRPPLNLATSASSAVTTATGRKEGLRRRREKSNCQVRDCQEQSCRLTFTVGKHRGAVMTVNRFEVPRRPDCQPQNQAWREPGGTAYPERDEVRPLWDRRSSARG
jgi:hypothetical protein